jgi:hypothetical protein
VTAPVRAGTRQTALGSLIGKANRTLLVARVAMQGSKALVRIGLVDRRGSQERESKRANSGQNCTQGASPGTMTILVRRKFS